MNRIREIKVEVRQFLTRANPDYPDRKPVPFRTMFGYITGETDRGIKVALRGRAEASSTCMRCGQKITNETSLQYGIGSECINHIPGAVPLVEDGHLEDYIQELKKRTSEVTWEGWLPKGHIKITETGNEIEPFLKEEEQKEEKPEKEEALEEVPKIEKELVEELTEELNSMYS